MNASAAGLARPCSPSRNSTNDHVAWPRAGSLLGDDLSLRAALVRMTLPRGPEPDRLRRPSALHGSSTKASMAEPPSDVIATWQGR